MTRISNPGAHRMRLKSKKWDFDGGCRRDFPAGMDVALTSYGDPVADWVAGSTNHERDIHEEFTERLYADRADDRGRDHRYSGSGSVARVSGLHHPRESVGTDPRNRLRQDQ